jgi:glucosamine 6-phosphate synthetase-like amidotransferase/phosphosugar isomerase protein
VCGILGLLLHDATYDAAPEICEGLSLLQHRGQDAAGIVTCGHKGRFYQCKANGMVRDVFDKKAVSRLIGSMGIGHGIVAFLRRTFFWGGKTYLDVVLQCDTLLLDPQPMQRPSRST